MNRVLVRNSKSGEEQNLTQGEWDAIQSNPRVSKFWHKVKDLLTEKPKDIPPPSITVNNENAKPVSIPPTVTDGEKKEVKTEEVKPTRRRQPPQP